MTAAAPGTDDVARIAALRIAREAVTEEIMVLTLPGAVLFDLPFSGSQVADFRAGRVPDGRL